MRGNGLKDDNKRRIQSMAIVADYCYSLYVLLARVCTVEKMQIIAFSNLVLLISLLELILISLTVSALSTSYRI